MVTTALGIPTSAAQLIVCTGYGLRVCNQRRQVGVFCTLDVRCLPGCGFASHSCGPLGRPGGSVAAVFVRISQQHVQGSVSRINAVGCSCSTGRSPVLTTVQVLCLHQPACVTLLPCTVWCLHLWVHVQCCPVDLLGTCQQQVLVSKFFVECTLSMGQPEPPCGCVQHSCCIAWVSKLRLQAAFQAWHQNCAACRSVACWLEGSCTPGVLLYVQCWWYCFPFGDFQAYGFVKHCSALQQA